MKILKVSRPIHINAINPYTGNTSGGINQTVFNTYTGTTAPATYVNKNIFNTYTGNSNGSGTVNSGNTNYLAYYSSTGKAVSQADQSVIGGLTYDKSSLIISRYGFYTSLGNKPYLCIGSGEYSTNMMQNIGFGYGASNEPKPAEIGFQTTSIDYNTIGDLIFATRNTTAPVAATERVRINSAGQTLFGGSYANSSSSLVEFQSTTGGVVFPSATRANINSPATNTLTGDNGIPYWYNGNNWVSLGDNGYLTNPSGSYSHAEGGLTTASGNASHAEGYQTTANNDGAHAEGYQSLASGQYSHAEGISTQALGTYSHAEGYQTYGLNFATHSEGANTIANGQTSHAQGSNTNANGQASHTGGLGVTIPVIANGLSSFNHSYNTSAQTTGYGALSNFSAILGGYNNNIAITETGAAIIGGNAINLYGGIYSYTTAVSNLALMSTPQSGTTNYKLLVRDSTTGIVKQINSSFVSSTNFNTYSASTLTSINNRLLTTSFNTYSASTLTSINNRLLTTNFNTYSASTLTNINTKVSTANNGLTKSGANVRLGGGLTGATTITGTTANTLTFAFNALSTTSKPEFIIANNTVAIVNGQQNSPMLSLMGNGWKTTATAGSQSAGWNLYVTPNQGTTSPTATLTFQSSINGVNTTIHKFNSDGAKLTTLASGLAIASNSSTTGGLTLVNGGTPTANQIIFAPNASAAITLTTTNFSGDSLTLLNGTSSANNSTGTANLLKIGTTSTGFVGTSTANYNHMIMLGTINSTSTGTATMLNINPTITALSGALTGVDYNPTNNPTGTHIAIRATKGNVLIGNTTITTSTRLDIIGQGTTTANILRLADSTNTVKFTVQDSGVVSIKNVMNLATTTNASPVQGDLWYDGTNLKFRDSTTTRTITWV